MVIIVNRLALMAHPSAAQGFRDRLERIIAQTGLQPRRPSRAMSASTARPCRSCFPPTNDRLPRAETLAAIAKGCRISIDWLLGLSQREQIGAEIVQAALTIETQAHAPFDERFLRWQGETAGRKLRTVPMSFPDFMKIDDVMEFEYAAALGPEATPALAERRRQVEAAIREGGELEACVSLQALTAFAARRRRNGTASARTPRRTQLNAMVRLTADLYPAFRLFLYDLQRDLFGALHHLRAEPRRDLSRAVLSGAQRQRAYPHADAALRGDHPRRHGAAARGGPAI